MVYTRVRNKTDAVFREPLPKYYVLIHVGRFQLRPPTKVKNLQRPLLCLQGNDLLRPVHDSTIGLDRPPHDTIVVLEIDDNDFRGCIVVGFFAYAYVVVRFQRLTDRSVRIPVLIAAFNLHKY